MPNEPFVQIVDDEGEEAIEIPLEDDNTLLLSTLQAQFPGACGLKYRNTETKSFRGIRLNEGKFYPPLSDNDWGNATYICVFPKENKRKMDDSLENSTAKTKRIEKGASCSDLIVLGLPWKTTEQNLREHFEEFGELIMVQVKKDVRSGQPKGFGFIRFASYDAQRKVLAKKHFIGGRWCEVKIPNSKDGDMQHVPCKVYVGRCTEDITADDLREYFSQFGEITDVFIPKPFRAFAFVTFVDPEIAQSLCGEDHIVKGVSVHISSAAPKSDQNRKLQQRQQPSPHQMHDSNSRDSDSSGRRSANHSQGGFMPNASPQNGWSNSASRNQIDMPNLQSLGINSQGPSTPTPGPQAPPFGQRNFPQLYQNPGPTFGPIPPGPGGAASNMRPDNFLQQSLLTAWLAQRLTTPNNMMGGQIGGGVGNNGGGNIGNNGGGCIGNNNNGGGGGPTSNGNGGGDQMRQSDAAKGWPRQQSGSNAPQSTN